ncbi:Myb-like domain [Macleaya cordata]|uniref:Myb-like domain n=1 Tax=Macleaya cordata TaxID=56857 RepID=A0A200QYG5_MACCD|nr:Myb-like domain [Macleaya cordata]
MSLHHPSPASLMSHNSLIKYSNLIFFINCIDNHQHIYMITKKKKIIKKGKLAELGYKRSAEKCKEKFEEMNQLYCNDSTSNYSKNYRSFSELEALFEDKNPKTTSADEKMQVRTTDGGDQNKMGLNLEQENSGNETCLENPYVENQSMVKKQHRRKRKRYHKLELLKGLCEEIVNKIMVQQEELHKKLLQDMERKEEERVAREEAWKKKEMDRINKEIEIRAQEQAIACDRETTIIEFLKKFTSSNNPSQYQDLALKTDQDTTKTLPQNPNPPSSPSIFRSENSNSLSRVPTQNNPKLPTSSTVPTATKKPVSCTTQNNAKVPNSSHLDLACQNPSSLTTTQNNPDVTSSSSTTPLTVPQNPSSSSNDREENGKRWPRDEVYSLINLRCNLCSSGDDKESTKVPLWERISQGMLELGYKRSAKKCKEKWENINKYFRKTKDTNKKRSLDSKTCPYFHQLNSLYNQGRLILPSEGPENHSAGSTENHPESPETRVSGGFSDQAMVHANEGERNNIIQVSPLEFEY